MRDQGSLIKNIDWVVVALYAAMVIYGLISIYASMYDPVDDLPIYSQSLPSGRQLIWIGTSLVLIIFIGAIDYKFYEVFAYAIYIIILLMLIAVLFIGKEKAGSKSWFGVGDFGIQPSEFAKFATSLALARYLSNPLIRLEKWKEILTAGAILAIPAVLILAQNDTGSTLVFSIFIIPMFREGLSSAYPNLAIATVTLFILTLFVPQLYLLSGIGILGLAVFVLMRKTMQNIAILVFTLTLVSGVVTGVDYFINNVLQPHQQSRIKVLIDPNTDPLGAGWNVTQSKIAIGSGGMLGKGFLQGTQTKFDFVPEQSTDFIFCTIGEEFGWAGSFLLVAMFVAMFLRIIYLAERQKIKFARVYGYCVASVLFFHFLINLGMTMGLFPVIGIPLPFFSYGGSSLWAFTILLFIFLTLDAHRSNILSRE
jgi:rod shape determining protein RodA